MLEKCREFAVKPRLLDDSLHFAADPFHFGESRLVDLFRGQIERREHSHSMAVQLAAIRQLGRADRAPASWDIFLFHELAELAVARDDMARDRFPRRGRQSRTV